MKKSAAELDAEKKLAATAAGNFALGTTAGVTVVTNGGSLDISGTGTGAPGIRNARRVSCTDGAVRGQQPNIGIQDDVRAYGHHDDLHRR